MTAAAPGVLRRPRADVPETLHNPISIFRRVRDRGQFIVDGVMDAGREVDDRKSEVRERQRRLRRRR